MPTKIVSTSNAEHYVWGGDCDGWYLLQASGLSVITERMPPGRSEVRHHHVASRQLFYVLSGVLTIEVEHHLFEVHVNESLEVSPGQAHQTFNKSAADVTFLSISQPPSHGDRVLD